MRYISFATLLLAFTITSCATMSAEEKGKYLEQYRKIAADRQQRAFDGPHGIKDQYRAMVKDLGNSKRGRQALEKLVFTDNTGHGLDTFKKMLVDADVRAMNEIYTGEQLRYWVDFYQSDRGKKWLKTEDGLRQQLDAELAADTSKDPEPAIKRFEAAYKEASKEISDHFEAGVGWAAIKKDDQYVARRLRYRQEAQALYNKKLNAAITAYNKKLRKGKTKKSH